VYKRQILDCLRVIYEEKSAAGGDIRRCNVNVAATTVDHYRQLRAAGIGTYILFQETYHRPTYAAVHRHGPKRDYDWHTTAHHRAMTAGIDDVGFGVLFGLYDWRFELVALLRHARQLERDFGVGPHTISVPRIRPAAGQDRDWQEWAVSDDDFVYLTALLRLAVPYTGIILSTRETAAMRDRLLRHGVSQISAGSCTGVGGYSRRDAGHDPVQQFCVEDNRDPGEILLSLCRQGWLPSFCTACYRAGRTGDRFMQLAKSGEIASVCQPNALLTLKEYLLDYGDDNLRQAGEQAIAENLAAIGDDRLREQVEAELRKIERGRRDLFF
ncbi:MAG: [FeFe] hydrogenase H-cluster radical SAM maturase HydG, partial [Negativicutes bacterium]|nr:[FeFe] hydrogenase H-cluster radical SAM maturase HydG [Negativicutes bacterium]